ncbi:hypothetical protein BZA05DRAFT_443061 [Tricharina praecox]|uniref:uncharacterized protein n=1 Tax=Tricharina praecox TaxID=43433 RepID=UPI002220F53E|nr:uncharacterized protein BZA05DRAFT_443061 [Tricharina praecox]KAI5855408.1 hypothetical protein BZA05DRAFT_443061 [Tricharina praecox]
MGFLDKLQSKFELYKLEQRYTKRKRRTTFISDAVYVDGEYVYTNGQQPPSPQRSGFRVSSFATGSTRTR